MATLVMAGVQYYHVDYTGCRTNFYDAAGSCVATPLVYKGLPPIAAELDVEALRDDIRDRQQNGQSYREFTIRGMRAGVQGYFAFLRGQRVTYLGRASDQRTEWSPALARKTETVKRSIKTGTQLVFLSEKLAASQFLSSGQCC